MERSAWPKNLSSSRKRAIKELLHAQKPTKKLRDLFDAHSQASNNTGQSLVSEDLVGNVLRSFSNTPSLSSSAQSNEVLQVPTNACHVRGLREEKYDRCVHQIDQGCQATKLVQRTSHDPRLFLITYRGRHTSKIILKYPPLILDSPSPRDDSTPLSFNTSLIAEQDDDDDNNHPIFFDFLSVNQEEKLPSEDDLNPHGHSQDDNSNDNNESA
ncbi:hypothetical protein NL676_018810 [Syzygium grande]|nr:hypothetical protein NL676_018810 [Syzygium grande]